MYLLLSSFKAVGLKYPVRRIYLGSLQCAQFENKGKNNECIFLRNDPGMALQFWYEATNYMERFIGVHS